jgi:hypothetical protein
MACAEAVFSGEKEHHHQSAAIQKTDICSSVGILLANVVAKGLGVMFCKMEQLQMRDNLSFRNLRNVIILKWKLNKYVL